MRFVGFVQEVSSGIGTKAVFGRQPSIAWPSITRRHSHASHTCHPQNSCLIVTWSRNRHTTTWLRTNNF